MDIRTIHRETIKKLTDFYVDTFLPEILTHRCLDNTSESSEDNSDKLYCICQRPDGVLRQQPVQVHLVSLPMCWY